MPPYEVVLFKRRRVMPLPAARETFPARADVVSVGSDTRRVPKRNLVVILAVLLQNEALRISAGLTYARALVDELLRFKVKVNPVSLHDSYGAWRDGEHDDLVLAAAIAAWWGDRTGKPPSAVDFVIVALRW